MGTNDNIRKLQTRCKDLEDANLRFKVQLHELAKSTAASSLVSIEILCVIKLLTKKGIISDGEIRDTYREYKASQAEAKTKAEAKTQTVPQVSDSNADSKNPEQSEVQPSDSGGVESSDGHPES